MIDSSYLSALKYRCIGPTRGGRVVAIAADPVERSTFYFGAVAGGVWKTDDAGLYWENISDGQMGTASVGALAVAPSDPNVIYAGMGESTIRIDVTHGDGMYRSTDGGKTWSHLGLKETRHIGEICIHPEDPDTVWVAALGHSAKDNAERGVYRTHDGGKTWALVLHVAENAGAVDLSLDPTNPRIIFATTWEARRNFWSINSGGPGSGLWRSFDGGDTWENISTNPGMPEGTLGKIGVSISPAQPDRVWALVEAEGRKRGLYRSDNRGDDWEKVSSKAELAWRPWYYMHVIAHPTDPDTVYVMDMKAWKSIDGGKEFEEFHTPHGDNHDLWIDPNDPHRMIGCDDGGAFISLNEGRSWSSIYNQLTAQFYHVAVDDQYPYMVYGTQQDNSSIAVPSRTHTGGITWADCYAAGTGESGYIAPKPGDPNTVMVGAIGSSPGGGDALQKYDHKSKQIQLISVWPEGYHDGNTADIRFQWTYPIVYSPHDPETLYVAGNKVFKTTNEGQSWDTISPDLTHADPETMGVSGPLTMDSAGAEMYATIFSMVVSAHRQGVLMTGSDDGRVHVSTDDGGSWTDVTPPEMEKFTQITMLAESPHEDGAIYMTAARHKHGDYAPYVYKTSDLGQSWTSITNGLPSDDFCRVIREDPKQRGLLYVGTELGVYVSFDDGANWQPMQGNLPVGPVYDLVVKNDDLVIATHGRSFWILDDITPLHELAGGEPEGNHLFGPRETVRTPEHIFAGFWGRPGGKNYHVTLGQNATFLVDEKETGHKVKHMIDAGDDVPHGVTINYFLDGTPEEAITLTITDSDGNDVIDFTSDIPEEKEDRHGLYLTADAGMNAFLWPMRLPDGPQMDDSEFHKRPKGPLVLPGEYTATLTVGGAAMSQTFTLVTDPRIDVALEDLREQQSLLLDIQSALGRVIDGVNTCRCLTAQLDTWRSRLEGGDESEDMGDAIDAARAALADVESGLVQAELKSEGDTLNYREQLFEKLAGLPPVVSSADSKPTQQSQEVFAKLSAQADDLLARLDGVVTGEVAALNAKLADSGMDIVGT
ncbi:MAG: glycosyl hydrolase [Acidimicrobiia bacterium]|nr:glycosyl hydrolase [Acidimicrobiia bacterium]